MSKTRAQIEEGIADRIIALLDQGELPPWQRPWKISAAGSCRNVVSSKPYRGINRWLTMLTRVVMDYDDPRWLTFKQAQALGGHVKKGEKSTEVIFYKIRTQEEKGEPNGAGGGDSESFGGLGNLDSLEKPDRQRRYPVLRLYHIFNVEQTEGCKIAPLPEEETADHDPIEEAEAIVRAMPNPPRISHYEHDNSPPCYQPKGDLVRIPVQGRYSRMEDWYNTLFHELTHSTGHPKRLDRFGKDTPEGNIHSYGQEELVAGMGSAMLGEQAGTGHITLEQNAAYIKHWRDAIAADKSIVIRAASLAQKAVDHITNHQPQEAQAPQASDKETVPEEERELVAA